MTTLGSTFLAASRRYLTEEYFPRLVSAVRALPAGDLWWRPHDNSNAVGNLLLHLAGNVRQWMVSGVGGRPDIRERQAEFAAHGGEGDGGGTEYDAERLLERLARVLVEADQVLAAFPPDQLGDRRTIQGQEVTVFEAIYHVVEHFAMHTGQIQYIGKLRTGKDLQHYAVQDGIATAQWRRDALHEILRGEASGRG